MAGLLVFLAHPDDEFFCAGLIAATVRSGAPVHLVCWTGGEGGMSPRRRLLLGLPHAWRPRVREMKRSAARLGVTSLTFLGYLDPRPAHGLAAPDFDPAELTPRIAGLIAHHQPGLVVTHGSDGDYGHPAHRALHRIVRDVCCGPGRTPVPFLTFNASWTEAPEARFLNPHDTADVVLDSRPYRRKKLQVFRSHPTQGNALRSMIRTSGSSLRELLHKTRYEGYHCWNTGPLRTAALEKFREWTRIR